ncbi:MAG TPA: hypothetical protein VHU92_00470 [Streptosporangiaceae bacterium]|nr:hypothetical protein [Streptosporangiaceae bacterium]
MNTDVEDLLRQGMERFTADLRAPAGLTGRAARRRRRRLARRSAGAAAAVLAAGAVAVAAVVVPGAGHISTRGRITPTAYVLRRVDSALSAADPGAIAQMTVRTLIATPDGRTHAVTAKEWSNAGRWRSVTLSSAGQPIYAQGSGASSVYTVVSYLKHTWGRQRLYPGNVMIGPRSGSHISVFRAFSVPSGCVFPVPLLFQSGLPGTRPAAGALPATVARDLRTAISCGALRVTGRQRLDGVSAIELRTTPKSPVTETVWASPSSYLPLRVVARMSPGHPTSGQGAEVVQQTADFSWLPPTAPNLAKLTVPIPAGFRRVPLIGVLGPLLRNLVPQHSPTGVSVPGLVPGQQGGRT